MKNNKSGFIGVAWNNRCQKYRSYIAKEGIQHHLGYYETAEEAARVRDKKAIELYKEFAILNFPEQK